MKRILIAASVAAVLTVSIAPMAIAAVGSSKAPMYADTGISPPWTCEDGASPTDAVVGSVTLRLTADGTLMGSVTFKDAAPNASYVLHIAGNDINGRTCPLTNLDPLGVLDTDDKGKGKASFEITGVPEQPAVWVIAIAPGAPRVQSSAVSLTAPPGQS